VLLPVQRFIHTETTSGIVLLAATVLALLWANSPWSASYERFWNSTVALQLGGWGISHSVREWINDALMVVFFFVVGLEVKRELVHGELSDGRSASLPVVCAVGGMLVPAVLYSLFNHGSPGGRGWGIPMATDIAFALGVLALAGNRVPARIRIFLLALATVDDIGAILVIALFYSGHWSFIALAAAIIILAAMLTMRYFRVNNLLCYAPLAFAFWFAILESGIHATIAGVILGLITPTSPDVSKSAFRDLAERLLAGIKSAVRGDQQERGEAMLGEMEELAVATESPADRLVRVLHPWSSFFVLPAFALANAGVAITSEVAWHSVASPVTRGILAGLVLGKLVGIVGFAYVSIRLGIASLMPGVRWSQLAGVGLMGGIGFTVALFMTDLAFTDASTIACAKLGVLLASVASGIAGYLVLRYTPASYVNLRSEEPCNYAIKTAELIGVDRNFTDDFFRMQSRPGHQSSIAAARELRAENSGGLLCDSPEETAAAQICERLKKMGYSVGRHIRLYGERLEVISDPFPHDGLIAVRVRRRGHASERVLYLPKIVLQHIR
jgi:NhaA family Na+:H+ antiporter